MADGGRVIAGSARGVRLLTPGGGATRPLTDRVKEALFGSSRRRRSRPWPVPFLDLFAGSGAAGIEALSRGASQATFVERDRTAAASDRRQPAPRAASASARSSCRADVPRFLRGRCPARRARPLRRSARWIRRTATLHWGRRWSGSAIPPAAGCARTRWWSRSISGATEPAVVPGDLVLARERAFRRDGAHLLPPGGLMTTALYPGSFDPITSATWTSSGGGPSSTGGRGRARQPAQVAAASPRASVWPSIREAVARSSLPPLQRVEVAGFRRPDRRLRTDARRRASSSAVCAPSATSSPSCRWPTPTASWRPTSTRSSS